MKRTCRVEVIRYSRRSTVISNELALETDRTAEQAAIDVLLGIPCTTESPIEETTDAEGQVSATYQQTDQNPDRKGGQADAAMPGVVQERRPLRFLKRLIRV